jgi:beta-lactam-binding protein with PASTA domain
VTDEPSGTVPNLEGLSARDAVRQLVTLGLNPRLSGDGVVVSQNPPPGTPIEPDGLCRLVLERQPARHPARATQP